MDKIMDKIEEVLTQGKLKKEQKKFFGASIKATLFSKIEYLNIHTGVSREGIVIAGVEAIEKRIEELKLK